MVLRLRKRIERDREREKKTESEREKEQKKKKDERKTKAEDVKLYRPVKAGQVLDVYCDVERREGGDPMGGQRLTEQGTV